MPKNAHMNDIAFLLRPDLKKKNKKKTRKDWPTDPPKFQPKRGNKHFLFLGLIENVSDTDTFIVEVYWKCIEKLWKIRNIFCCCLFI